MTINIKLTDALFPGGGIWRFIKRNAEGVTPNYSGCKNSEDCLRELDRATCYTIDLMGKGGLLTAFQILVYVPFQRHIQSIQRGLEYFLN